MVILTTRTNLGKNCKKLRKDGNVPAVLFGKTYGSVSAQIDSENMKQVKSNLSGAKPFKVSLDGKEILCIIQGVDRDPVSEEIAHVNMRVLDENSEVVVQIPVHVTGVSPAVKNGWGVLMHVSDQIVIKTLPKNIPEFVEIDISDLDRVGSNITFKDVVLPEGVSLAKASDSVRVLVTVASPQKIEETTTVVEGEEGEEGAVEGEEGAVEGGEEPAAEAKE